MQQPLAYSISGDDFGLFALMGFARIEYIRPVNPSFAVEVPAG
jgi:hypothetical protein